MIKIHSINFLMISCISYLGPAKPLSTQYAFASVNLEDMAIYDTEKEIQTFILKYIYFIQISFLLQNYKILNQQDEFNFIDEISKIDMRCFLNFCGYYASYEKKYGYYTFYGNFFWILLFNCGIRVYYWSYEPENASILPYL